MEVAVYLGPEDDAVIITCDGILAGIWTETEEDAYQNADAIQEIMIDAMREADHAEGVWCWTIAMNWKVVIGQKIGEDE